MIIRQSPDECPVCGAAHTTCTAGGGPITTVMAPARDATATESERPPLVSESVSLAPGQFSTATYRGAKGKK